MPQMPFSKRLQLSLQLGIPPSTLTKRDAYRNFNMRDIVRGILLLAACLGSRIVANGYPMIVEIAEESERCLRLNIPQDDDAHLVFLAVPSPASADDQEEGDSSWAADKQIKLEAFFFQQMIDLVKYRVHSTLPRKFADQPTDEIQKLMNEFFEVMQEGDKKSGVQVKLNNPKSTSSRTMETFWFTPVVINYVRKAVKSRKGQYEATPLEGYSMCFVNQNEEPVLMMVDSVMTSEEPDSADSEDEAPVFESAHLTPLAEQLQESIQAAQSVVKEMGYMERREQRMRKTADSINSRVRYFSYISVAVLLVVTYVQVTYLKRYFHKKKLL